MPLSSSAFVLLLASGSQAASQITFDFETTNSPGWTSIDKWWTSGGDPQYKFRRVQGTSVRPPGSTGPSSGYGGSGYYYHAFADRPRQKSDLFVLAYDGSGCTGGDIITTVDFYYNMNGRDTGELRLVHSANVIAWSQSGDKGDEWRGASVTINARSFRFEYTKGEGEGPCYIDHEVSRTPNCYYGDTAIDQVTITCNTSPPFLPPLPPLPPPPLPPPYLPIGTSVTFDFETTHNPGWTTGGGISSPWRRYADATPARCCQTSHSGETGPSKGYGGSGYYFFVEHSGQRLPDGTVPKAVLSYDGRDCNSGSLITSVEFAYHMYGQRLGTLSLLDGQNQTRWARTGPQLQRSPNVGLHWLTATVLINSPSFRFEYDSIGSIADPAVDHVTIVCGFASPPSPPLPPSAPPFPLQPSIVIVACGSESAQCGANLAEAYTYAQSGDVLILQSGVYTSSDLAVLTVRKSITLRAQISGTAVLDGEHQRQVIVTEGTDVKAIVLEGLSIKRGITDRVFGSLPAPYGKRGGCMSVVDEGGARVDVRSCTFSDCWALQGTNGACLGVEARDTTLRIESCNFDRCSAITGASSSGLGGTAIYQAYGHLYMNATNVSDSNTCRFCTAEYPVYLGSLDEVIITDSLIQRNKGGGLSANRCRNFLLRNTNFSENVDGAGLYFSNSGPVYVDSVSFRDNQGTSTEPSAIYSRHNARNSIFLSNVVVSSNVTYTGPTILADALTLNFTCPLGRWMRQDGRMQIDFDGCAFECLPGTYGASPFLTSAADCTACPTGKTSPVGAASLQACSCPLLFYYNGAEQGSCVSCPLDRTDCTRLGITLSTLPLQPNFWRVSARSEQVLPCFTDSVCIGTANALTRNAADTGRRLQDGVALDPDPASTYGDGICRVGHVGPFCEVCAAAWYRGADSICRDCEAAGGSVEATIAIPIVLLVLALGVAVYFIYRTQRSAIRAAARAAMEAASADMSSATIEGAVEGGLEDRLGRHNLRGLLVRVKIFLSLIQVITQISRVFSVTFPPVFTGLLRWIGFLQLDVFTVIPLPCIFESDFHSLLLLRTIIPLAIMSLLSCTSWLLVREASVSSERGEARALLGGVLINLTFMILFCVYPSTSSTIFTTFQCEDLDDGSSWLRADLSIDCNSSKHVAMTTYAAIMIVVYPLGAPAVYAYLLFGKYGRTLWRLVDIEVQQATLLANAIASDKYDASTASSRRSIQKLHQDGVKTRLVELSAEEARLKSSLPGFVQTLAGNGYALRVFYFEIIECIRKLSLVCVPVFFPAGSVSQLVFGLMICFLTYGLYSATNPYGAAEDNYFAKLSQIIIFFTILSSVVLQTVVPDDVVAQAMDYALTALFCLPAVMEVLIQSGFNVCSVHTCDSLRMAASKRLSTMTVPAATKSVISSTEAVERVSSSAAGEPRMAI